jgi:hypothetical protein
MSKHPLHSKCEGNVPRSENPKLCTVSSEHIARAVCIPAIEDSWLVAVRAAAAVWQHVVKNMPRVPQEQPRAPHCPRHRIIAQSAVQRECRIRNRKVLGAGASSLNWRREALGEVFAIITALARI